MNIAVPTNLAFFGNLAGPDMIIILLVVLLLFGAKKLPELAKGMGQAVREFSKAKDEVEHEIMRPPPAVQPPQRIEEPKVAAATDVPAADPHSNRENSQNPTVDEFHASGTTHQV
jgi:sec-independent protein translocase protein TatA